MANQERSGGKTGMDRRAFLKLVGGAGLGLGMCVVPDRVVKLVEDLIPGVNTDGLRIPTDINKTNTPLAKTATPVPTDKATNTPKPEELKESTATATSTSTETTVPSETPRPTETSIPPEVSVAEIDSDDLIYGYDRGQGRKVIPLGISREYVYPAKEGEPDEYFVSGILLKAAYDEDKNVVNYTLGIPKGDKFNTFVVVDPLLWFDKELGYLVSATSLPKSPAGGYSFSATGKVSRSYSVDEALDGFKGSLGKQVAFMFAFSESKQRMEKYYQSWYEIYDICTPGSRCDEVVKMIIDGLPETYEVINNLRNGTSADGKSVVLWNKNLYAAGFGSKE